MRPGEGEREKERDFNFIRTLFSFSRNLYYLYSRVETIYIRIIHTRYAV
jgi:hypothetical protein